MTRVPTQSEIDQARASGATGSDFNIQDQLIAGQSGSTLSPSTHAEMLRRFKERFPDGVDWVVTKINGVVRQSGQKSRKI